MVIAIDTLRLLRKRNLPKDTVRVLWFIWESVEFGNVTIGTLNTEIASACGVTTRRVSSCLNELAEQDFIRRGHKGSGIIYANPNHAFRGIAVDQRKAVETWSKGEALQLVPRRKRQA